MRYPIGTIFRKKRSYPTPRMVEWKIIGYLLDEYTTKGFKEKLYSLEYTDNKKLRMITMSIRFVNNWAQKEGVATITPITLPDELFTL